MDSARPCSTASAALHRGAVTGTSDKSKPALTHQPCAAPPYVRRPAMCSDQAWVDKIPSPLISPKDLRVGQMCGEDVDEL